MYGDRGVRTGGRKDVRVGIERTSEHDFVGEVFALTGNCEHLCLRDDELGRVEQGEEFSVRNRVAWVACTVHPAQRERTLL